MILIENVLVDPVLLQKNTFFCCDVLVCKGACCVAGDAGAPLEMEEIIFIQDHLDDIKPFMQSQIAEYINTENFFDYDADGNLVTALHNGKECVFAYFHENIAYCAIESAFMLRKISFRKPISCFLYPIRVETNGYFKKIIYHRWDICRCAIKKGQQSGCHILHFLKEALQQKFGKKWYILLYQKFREQQDK